jgi:hypothetical protein
MKSSFLVSIVLSALVSASALGQTNRRPRRVQRNKPATARQKTKTTAKPTAAPTTQTTTQSVSGASAAEKSPFDRFYERLSISYFGVITSPTLENWDSRNAAISPAYGDTGKAGGCHRNCDTYAMNLWNQVNFAYDFGWKLKFVFIPRATIYFNNPHDMSRSAGEDRAMFGLEDFLVGFAGTIYSSEDKKFNWYIRPAMRLPTSHFTRHYDHPVFGDLTHQLEASHYITYDANPQLQFGLQLQQRWWIFEDRYNFSRLRLYTSPYIQYAMTEKTKVAVYYQNMLENNKRWKSINNKEPVYKDVYQDMMFAVGHQITPAVSLMPYLGVFVDDVPLSMRSTYLGAWISWSIK